MASLWDNKGGGIGAENPVTAELAQVLDKDIKLIQDYVTGAAKARTTQALGTAGDLGELMDTTLTALTDLQFKSPNDRGFPTTAEIEKKLGVYNENPSVAEQAGSFADPVHLIKAGLAGALKSVVIPLRKEGLKVTLAHPSTFYGDDGKLRTELLNSGASWKGKGIDNYLNSQLMPKVNPKTGKLEIPTANLDQLINFPELFDHVPDARNIQVQRMPGMFDWNNHGSFDPETGVIKLNPRATTSQYSATPGGGPFDRDRIEGDDLRLETLMHEVQHWIQNKFGYSPGGNKSQFVPEELKDTWDAGKSVIQKKFTQIRDQAKEVFNNDKEWFGGAKQIEEVAKKDPELAARFKDIDNLYSQRLFFDSKYHAEYEALPGEVESRVDASRLRLTQQQAENYPFEQHYKDEMQKAQKELTDKYRTISHLKKERGSLK